MGNVAVSGEKAYKIKTTEEKMLGQGSYANVYRIKRRDTYEPFAAKIFKIPYKEMTKIDTLGYQRELEILKTAEHPFVIKYIEEFVYQERQLCIVT